MNTIINKRVRETIETTPNDKKVNDDKARETNAIISRIEAKEGTIYRVGKNEASCSINEIDEGVGKKF